MSEVATFFRTCPQCGRRFQIRLVSKKLLDSRINLEKGGQVGPASTARVIGPPGDTGYLGAPVNVSEGPPITIAIEDFEYVYKCAHCGYVWIEVRTQSNKAE